MNTAIEQQAIISTTPVESRQIAAIGHDPETNTLAIQFKNWKGELGSTYHYQNFTPELFVEFMGAESKGSYFGKQIKSSPEKFPYKKVS